VKQVITQMGVWPDGRAYCALPYSCAAGWPTEPVDLNRWGQTVEDAVARALSDLPDPWSS